KCVRLYSERAFYEEMLPAAVPEIQRCNLGNVILLLKSLRVHNILAFDLLDPPPRRHILHALKHLFILGALSPEGGLTRTGRALVNFPLDPPLAKVLVAAQAPSSGPACLPLALSVVALEEYEAALDRLAVPDSV
ncbi:hypothetical protein T484DRAFT_1820895, partial [Baffinella frigidus]